MTRVVCLSSVVFQVRAPVTCQTTSKERRIPFVDRDLTMFGVGDFVSVGWV